ncbi:MAG: hypothetical protein ACYDH9_11495 [Limisphaerales bacterium]
MNPIAVVDKLPREHLVRYDLACYAAQLGRLADAQAWLERAIAWA